MGEHGEPVHVGLHGRRRRHDRTLRPRHRMDHSSRSDPGHLAVTGVRAGPTLTRSPPPGGGPLTSLPMARTEATGELTPQSELGGAPPGDHRHVGARLRPARLPRHRHHGALRRQRPRQGRALPLHRLQRGAPRRHPRPGDGRGDARRRPCRRGRRLAVEAAGHARRRAARRDPPLPRSRLGLPARVPGADRRARRPVPRSGAASTSDGSRRSSRPASTRASSGSWSRG